MKYGDKVRVYIDYWGARNVFCLVCATWYDEENGGLSIAYPAYAECECDQCGQTKVED